MAARVTQRFYRADPARTRNRGGSGLGMSIADAAVNAHGGEIAVESEVGQGTTVTVTVTLPSAFDSSRGEALGQEALGDEEQDDDRNRDDHRAGHQHGLGHLGGVELLQSERNVHGPRSDWRNRKANRNSFHAIMNTYSETEAMAGPTAESSPS